MSKIKPEEEVRMRWAANEIATIADELRTRAVVGCESGTLVDVPDRMMRITNEVLAVVER